MLGAEAVVCAVSPVISSTTSFSSVSTIIAFGFVVADEGPVVLNVGVRDVLVISVQLSMPFPSNPLRHLQFPSTMQSASEWQSRESKWQLGL